MKSVFVFILFSALTTGTYCAPDTWVQKSSLPASPRIGAVAFSLGGFGYTGTGIDSSGLLLSDFWKYDPITDSWSQAADFAGTPRRNAVAFATDTFGYVGTGYDSTGLTKDFFRYDPSLNSWTQVQDLDSANSVNPRRDATAFSAGNKGYIVSGYDGTTFFSKETWEYDANRDTVWQARAVFPVAGRRWGTSFSIDGLGFVGMGFNYSQEYFNDFWKFDPISNVWTQVANYPGNDRGNAVSFVINAYGFVGSGFDGTLQNDFYKYDYAVNAWSPIADYGANATSSAVAFEINGKGYVCCGFDTLGYKNDLWEYTPDHTVHVSDQRESSIVLYPNPAVSQIHFTKPVDDLRLFEGSGRLIVEHTTTIETLDVSGLIPGIYYYTIVTSRGTVTGKLILR